MLDLHLYPLHIKNSSEQTYLPGLHFVLSPRFAVRARQGDILLMLLSSSGEQFIPNDRISSILDLGAKSYFRSSGTITAGIRSCVEEINQAILTYNLQESVGNKQQSCLLNISIVHDERVYIGHSGYTHSFVLSKNDTEHFFDPELSGRGLGLSRSATVRFFLSELHENEYVLFSPEPLSTWTPANLAGSPAIAFDYLRRRLLNQVSPNIRALLIQAVSGTGKVILEAPLSSKNGYFAPPAKEPQAATPTTQKTRDGKEIPLMAIPSQVKKEPTAAPALKPEPSMMSGQQKVVKPLPVSDHDDENFEDPSFREILNGYKQEASDKFISFKGSFNRIKQKLNSQPDPSMPSFATKPKIKLPPINFTPLLEKLKIFRGGARKAATVTGSTLQFAGEKIGGALGDAVDYVTPEGGFKNSSTFHKNDADHLRIGAGSAGNHGIHHLSAKGKIEPI